MIDLAITTEPDAENPVRGDLLIQGTELVLVEGGDAVAQELTVRLRWWLGEWFLDQRQGVPYLQRILRKGVSPRTVRAIVRRQIGQVPGVARVDSLRVELGPLTREVAIDFEVVTVEGERLTASALRVGR